VNHFKIFEIGKSQFVVLNTVLVCALALLNSKVWLKCSNG